jgi:nucleotide-binding universal stress UspA family protein
LDVDVIVMGSHSRRGLEKILMGSVAEKVLRNSTLPLFIIPVVENEKK